MKTAHQCDHTDCDADNCAHGHVDRGACPDWHGSLSDLDEGAFPTDMDLSDLSAEFADVGRTYDVIGEAFEAFEAHLTRQSDRYREELAADARASRYAGSYPLPAAVDDDEVLGGH